MSRILIIDPNIPFRESLGKIISDRFPRIEIQESAAADEGLRKLNTFVPQLIFIDICLPDRNGLDLAKFYGGNDLFGQFVANCFDLWENPTLQFQAFWSSEPKCRGRARGSTFEFHLSNPNRF